MIVLDAMEYATDGAAQTAWGSSIEAAFSGGTPTAESAYGPAPPHQAVDGNTATYWLSNNSTPNWWKYDFGAGKEKILTGINICKINVGGADQNIKDFTVYGSNDDLAYAELGTFQAAQESDKTWESFYFNNTTAYRYYKVNITTNYRSDGYSGFYEITYYIGGVSVYSESTIKKEGLYSMRISAFQTSSLNTTLARTISPTYNLSGQTDVKIRVRASRTGTNFKLGLHDSGGTTTESNIAISSANTWEEKTIDISAVADADKDAIDSIILTITNADAENTIYLDYLIADNVTWPDAKYIYHGVDRGDGTTGTLRASNIKTNTGCAGVDLSAAILKKASVVDDVTGTYEGVTAGSKVFEAETGEPFLMLTSKMITRIDGEIT